VVHTHLREARPSPAYDLTDLALLRLEVVAAIHGRCFRSAGQLNIAHRSQTGTGRPKGTWRDPGRSRRRAAHQLPQLIAGSRHEYGRVPRSPRSTQGKDRALLRSSQASADGGTTVIVVGREGRVAEAARACRNDGVKVLDVLVKNRPEADSEDLVGRGKLDESCARDDRSAPSFRDPLRHRTSSRVRRERIQRRRQRPHRSSIRTMLISTSSSKHATSRDCKLQVESPQLRYSLPRWSRRERTS